MVDTSALRKASLVLLATAAALAIQPAAGSAGTIIHFQTSLGRFNLLLYDDAAVATTVRNFLGYVHDGDYDNSIFHRLVSDFIIQGGGFSYDGDAIMLPTDPAIPLEAHFSNTRGTIAMARTHYPDTATSQFFFNLVDNAFLDASAQSAGYAVFGEVMGDGMAVVDLLASQRTWPAEAVHSHWGELPMVDYPGGVIEADSPIHDHLEWIISVDLAGDTNGDGYVDDSDLDDVFANWGRHVSGGDLLPADITGDGFVGQDDLDTILGNWHRGLAAIPPAGMRHAPEPATISLLAVGVLAIVPRSRRQPASAN